MQNGEDLASYTMGNAKKEDGDDQSEIQLHRMKPQEHFIEAQIQEGDTLQAIALRFYCSVSLFLCADISISCPQSNHVRNIFSKTGNF